MLGSPATLRFDTMGWYMRFSIEEPRGSTSSSSSAIGHSGRQELAAKTMPIPAWKLFSKCLNSKPWMSKP